MKKWSKIVTLILTVSMLVSVLCVNSYAIVENTPGKQVAVTFTFPDAYGADGKISYSNAALFSAVTVTSSGAVGTCTKDAFFLYGTQKTTINVIVTVTIKANAAVGDSCKITLGNCEYAYDINGNMKTVVDKSETVKVKAVPSKPADTQPQQPVDTTPVTPVNPITPPSGVDYTELKRQINIAGSLSKNGYTDESWKSLTDALAAAKGLLNGSSQTAVDKSAKDLEKAISDLKKVDYKKLMASLEAANSYLKSNELADLFAKFKDAFDAANAAMTSGNQAEIDKTSKALDDAYQAFKDKLDELSKPEIKEVPVEVKVETEPTEPYCNIGFHTVIKILLIISAIINLAFIALLILYFLRRRKDTEDDTPLVDYHIGDDEEESEDDSESDDNE